MESKTKARIAIFQLSDHAYESAPPAPRRTLRLTQVFASYPVTRERIDALLVIENLHVPVRMAFTVSYAPVDAPHELVATSEEIVVEGDGRPVEVILRARSVTLSRAGRYEFELLANGKSVKAQGVMFGVGDERSPIA